ncbi:MAG: ferredoxin [Bacteroidetes bacterium OLB11]|nr:MAG: ferredoxin [Bacteroidetes bacterium OLB11]
MVIITHQREKCIGCNYCVELAFQRWRMSKKDGKVTLISGVNKKGFYSTKVGDEELEDNLKAAQACPMNIIQVKKN